MLKLKKLGFLLLLNALMIMSAHADQEKNLVNIPTPGLDLLTKATLIKSLEPDTKISFIVWLKLRNKNELDRYVRDIYDPHSPRYQQFLTSTHYEQKFAPSQNAEKTVQNYFASYGMKTKIINHSVRVTGTAEQIWQSLHVHMNYYRYRDKIAYANSSNPQLDSEPGQYIVGISGLNLISKFYAKKAHVNTRHFKSDNQEINELNLVWDNFIPSAIPTTTSLNGFTGAQLQTTYKLSKIPPINGVTINGYGQTLIIIDLCSQNNAQTILNNANVYFSANSIVPSFMMSPTQGTNFAIINADGTSYSNCAYPANPVYDIEIAIDIQSSHTIAPGANTVLVLGNGDAPIDEATTLSDVISTLTQNNYTIAGFSNAYVISNSWSLPESKYADANLEQSLETAAAFGISVNFSSGDCGDNTYVSTADPKCSAMFQSNVPVTNYPPSSTYVTAVGGTSLFVDQNYNYAFETVWGSVGSYPSGNPLSFFDGTTGGISTLYGPVFWQSAISNFSAGGYGKISAFGNHRATPDISMLGDFGTGLLIYEGSMPFNKEGGTSLACPLFSSTLVLVNQARALLNKGPIGQAAPYLYLSNNILLASKSLNLIIPPALIISGATPPPTTPIQNIYAPASAFTIGNITIGWDSSLTVEPENQFWNDGVGVGSPNLPNFVPIMANM